MFWLTFLFGMMVGAAVMAIVIGLCSAAGRAELEEEITMLKYKLGMNK